MRSRQSQAGRRLVAGRTWAAAGEQAERGLRVALARASGAPPLETGAAPTPPR
jgi:hypothetical protein